MRRPRPPQRRPGRRRWRSDVAERRPVWVAVHARVQLRREVLAVRDLAPVLGMARDALDRVLEARRVAVVGVPLQVLLAREGAEGSAVDLLEGPVAGDLAGEHGARGHDEREGGGAGRHGDPRDRAIGRVHRWAPCFPRMASARRCGLDLDRELVDLGGGVSRALVDLHHGLLRGARREAEHLAGVGVEPGTLEVHVLVALDCQVAIVRLAKLLGGDAEEPVVDVHVLVHALPPWRTPSDRRRGPSRWPPAMRQSSVQRPMSSRVRGRCRGSAPRSANRQGAGIPHAAATRWRTRERSTGGTGGWAARNSVCAPPPRRPALARASIPASGRPEPSTSTTATTPSRTGVPAGLATVPVAVTVSASNESFTAFTRSASGASDGGVELEAAVV